MRAAIEKNQPQRVSSTIADNLVPCTATRVPTLLMRPIRVDPSAQRPVERLALPSEASWPASPILLASIAANLVSSPWPSSFAAIRCSFGDDSGDVMDPKRRSWVQEVACLFPPALHAQLRASIAQLGRPCVRWHSIFRKRAHERDDATIVPCPLSPNNPIECW